MPKRPMNNPPKAGIFNAWDGKLTGPQPGEPGPVADRNQSWSSVQKRQSPKTFTAQEVKEIVAEAITALKDGKEPSVIEEIVEKHGGVTHVTEEQEFTIGGK